MNISIGLTSLLGMIVMLNISMTDKANTDDEMIQQSNSITVMSYNIRFDNPDDGMNAWPHRKEFVAEIMGEKYQADVIGVQEAQKNQIDDLLERLPGYSWVGVGRDDGRNEGEFSPVFYRTSRFDLVATNTFWLSDTPYLPGSKSWDTAITRVVTWAIFTDLNTGQDFYFINTHFDHLGEKARVESAKMIVEFISEIDRDFPVVFTGDLNVTESSEAYSVLQDTPGLHDARYVSETGHEGPTATFNDWKELRPPESRIDYIFVRDGIRVLCHRIADDRYKGRFPSDHLPVVSKLMLNSPQRR